MKKIILIILTAFFYSSTVLAMKGFKKSNFNFGKKSLFGNTMKRLSQMRKNNQGKYHQFSTYTEPNSIHQETPQKTINIKGPRDWMSGKQFFGKNETLSPEQHREKAINAAVKLLKGHNETQSRLFNTIQEYNKIQNDARIDLKNQIRDLSKNNADPKIIDKVQRDHGEFFARTHKMIEGFTSELLANYNREQKDLYNTMIQEQLLAEKKGRSNTEFLEAEIKQHQKELEERFPRLARLNDFKESLNLLNKEQRREEAIKAKVELLKGHNKTQSDLFNIIQKYKKIQNDALVDLANQLRELSNNNADSQIIEKVKRNHGEFFAGIDQIIKGSTSALLESYNSEQKDLYNTMIEEQFLAEKKGRTNAEFLEAEIKQHQKELEERFPELTRSKGFKESLNLLDKEQRREEAIKAKVELLKLHNKTQFDLFNMIEKYKQMQRDALIDLNNKIRELSNNNADSRIIEKLYNDHGEFFVGIDQAIKEITSELFRSYNSKQRELYNTMIEEQSLAEKKGRSNTEFLEAEKNQHNRDLKIAEEKNNKKIGSTQDIENTKSPINYWNILVGKDNNKGSHNSSLFNNKIISATKKLGQGFARYLQKFNTR